MMVSCVGWGLEYLHKNTVLHRDVAAKNCLYDKQFVSGLRPLLYCLGLPCYHSTFQVKLIGFSMSKRATVYSMKTARRMAIRWMAPETIETFQYTQKSDVYGFGVRISLFTSRLPTIVTVRAWHWRRHYIEMTRTYQERPIFWINNETKASTFIQTLIAFKNSLNFFKIL